MCPFPFLLLVLNLTQLKRPPTFGFQHAANRKKLPARIV